VTAEPCYEIREPEGWGHCGAPARWLITWQTHPRLHRPPQFTEPRCDEHRGTTIVRLDRKGHRVVAVEPVEHAIPALSS
jgi:hypothetical protein